MVNGEPAPTVTWGRNKGDVADSENYKTRYDERSQEHILEVIKQKLHLFVRVMYCTSTQLYIVKCEDIYIKFCIYNSS